MGVLHGTRLHSFKRALLCLGHLCGPRLADDGDDASPKDQIDISARPNPLNPLRRVPVFHPFGVSY
jgi:hypothetical protein